MPDLKTLLKDKPGIIFSAVLGEELLYTTVRLAVIVSLFFTISPTFYTTVIGLVLLAFTDWLLLAGRFVYYKYYCKDC